MSDISTMGNIIQTYGKDGLRFLLLFKSIKVQVKNKLLKQEVSILENDEELNQICAFAAKKLLVQCTEKPSEELIITLVSKLANLK